MSENNNNQIMVVYQNDGVYHFKPMKTLVMDKKTLTELQKHEQDEYIIAREFSVTVNDKEKPDKNGYYLADQLTYEIVEDGQFLKRVPSGKKDGKTELPFKDYKKQCSVYVTDLLSELEKGETENDDKVSVE